MFKCTIETSNIVGIFAIFFVTIFRLFSSTLLQWTQYVYNARGNYNIIYDKYKYLENSNQLLKLSNVFYLFLITLC